MGAAATIPAGFDTLNDEDKVSYEAKFQVLKEAGKTDDEAIAELLGSISNMNNDIQNAAKPFSAEIAAVMTAFRADPATYCGKLLVKFPFL